jgi:hypothetical protein
MQVSDFLNTKQAYQPRVFEFGAKCTQCLFMFEDGAPPATFESVVSVTDYQGRTFEPAKPILLCGSCRDACFDVEYTEEELRREGVSNA